ncbi:response regulator [Rhodovulum sp. BSW8]|uniref:Response regulator n=1 Tax=Rhodovulum visakhapatnamense TaxID=364297 RepID=A0A4R8FVZ2_9RHOB|nr:MULTISPECIES: response regulator [Rhodovulum]OLS46234.1 two-component system response regulator [Rhodovulum sulfidophilum]MBL3568043.1 response regulator [Rhodovulum visakhapatnamense]MBL3577934.1 response regulator [Rhodovulum visakhapatnamense]RBO51487.1 response regulator [Rhodovulum sp. BSW8]TDX30717.1 response regulator receiver protein [Rhodovulum visakhapatnamense]
MINILAIDDSLTIREMVRETLSSAGFAVTTANDGQAGVDEFVKDRYDAVITDINMPKMDGFGVIEHIRGGGTNARVPILVLTTESGSAMKERARAAGATGWIVKPFQDEGLISVIRRVTGAR